MNTSLLKEIRSQTGLSIAEFARLFNKSKGWYQHIESGDNQMKIVDAKLCVKIAKKHGINITPLDLYD